MIGRCELSGTGEGVGEAWWRIRRWWLFGCLIGRRFEGIEIQTGDDC